MKFARYLAHGQVSYGVLEGDTLREITTTPFEEFEITDHAHSLSEVKLLPPTAPSKVLAVGRNYRSHIRDLPVPDEPEIFLKTPSCLIGSGDAIIRPNGVEKFQEEGEMVVVMKTRCKNVSSEDALKYVLGYTCGNDVSARDWQRADRQWWRAKSSDTFGPVGPVIEDDLDPRDAIVRVRLNGKEIRAENAANMIFDIPTAISYISRRQTLEPGDLIFTGCLGTPVELNGGDIVEVAIDGIGILSNPVKTEE
jgi:2-keto-4-pentenoate hydratase/2-oxohepta-3-ene-1,7-dioic acid hydratase in catechol pathway